MMPFPVVLVPIAFAFLTLALGTMLLNMVIESVNKVTGTMLTLIAEICGTVALYTISCFFFALAVMG